jgi:hypothetical protein
VGPFVEHVGYCEIDAFCRRVLAARIMSRSRAPSPLVECAGEGGGEAAAARMDALLAQAAVDARRELDERGPEFVAQFDLDRDYKDPESSRDAKRLATSSVTRRSAQLALPVDDATCNGTKGKCGKTRYYLCKRSLCIKHCGHNCKCEMCSKCGKRAQYCRIFRIRS